MKNKQRIAAAITALLAGYAAYRKASQGIDIDVGALIKAVNIVLGGN